MGFWSSPLWALTGAAGLTPTCEDEYASVSREPYWVLEIDVPRCTLEMGTAPCTATGRPDGRRCFYSRHTCPDPANFTSGTTTLRFVSNGIHYGRAPGLWASWSQVWPLISKVSPVSQQLETTAGFTLPDSLTVHMDELGSDNRTALDPTMHVLHRDVPVLDLDKTTRNSTRGGQFWRRFVAIWPNYRNFPVRLKRGFASDTFTIYDLHPQRKGKLENIGFESSGAATLKIADLYGGEQAGLEREIPRKPSTANVVATTVSRSATSVTVLDGTAYPNPASVGYSVYLQRPGSQEILQVTAISGNVLTIARGKFGTLGEPLREGDTLAEVVPYLARDGQGGWSVADIVTDLLLRGGIAATDIDSAQMTRECLVLGAARLRRLITEPKAVNALITEVCELAMASVFIDESLRFRLSLPRPRFPGEAA